MDNAKRAAVNTLINYIQLGLNVVISLITVRLVLRSLGEIDYGIYNLIGGIIVLISFISESLSQTSIRFISVSLGKKELKEVRSVFSSCFSLHLYMAVLLSIILELIGGWLFGGFLNIPYLRLSAAKIVYHCLVVTLSTSIIATPFRAVLIAHERFSLIAIIGVLESLLKLSVAIAVFYAVIDKLVLYGVLMAMVSIIILLCFVLASYKSYRGLVNCKLATIREIKNIAHFAGWTILDVFGAVANRQGYAIMLNKFFGPSVNAVFALAQHVESPLFSMSASAINSIKPQILKSYGERDFKRTIRLAFTAGKIGFSLMALLAIPLFVMLPDVLTLWLGNYPIDTVFYARMMILACLMNQLSLGLITANQAFGKIKWFSIVVSSVRMSALPISIVFLLLGSPARVTMIIYVACESLASVSRVVVMNRMVGMSALSFVRDVIIRVFPSVFVSSLLCVLFYKLSSNIWSMIATTCISAMSYCFCLYLFGLTEFEKDNVNGVVRNLLSRFR